MTGLPRGAFVAALTAAVIIATDQDATLQQPRAAVSVAVGDAETADELRWWDSTVDRMTRAGDLVVTSRLDDRALPGRSHEYLAQVVDGIRVLGGGISRQLDAGGATVSLFGTVHQDIDLDTTPTLSAAEVASRLEQAHDGRLVAGRGPALVVLPLPDGTNVLAYRVVMSDGLYCFADAGDGRVLHVADAFRSQSAVGGGSDLRGRPKKLNTTRVGTRYQTLDRLRPAEIVTLDGRFDSLRVDRLLLEHFFNALPPGEPVWQASDVAADTDNAWEDPAVVEAHAHTGWTYDYLYARHDWPGVDGANGRILSVVNLDNRGNAFFAPPPFGPEGTGVYAYGRVTDGVREEPLTSLDLVAHELMHGVTHFAVSRRTGDPRGLGGGFPSNTRLGPESFTDELGRTFTCDPDFGFWCVDGRFLLGSDEGGAIHEGYSDIVGESVGFFHEDQGATADYLVGGDQTLGPIRSLVRPRTLSIVGGLRHPYPDAYADRYEFAITRALTTTNPDATDPEQPPVLWDYSGFVFVDGRFVFSSGDPGYGGEHWNSTILSHAYYLAVEGGMNRTTGLGVEGVGDAGRGEVERIFFRAMTDLIPPTATLPLAANAIRQAAADLAPSSAAREAVEQALRAVGLAPEPDDLPQDVY